MDHAAAAAERERLLLQEGGSLRALARCLVHAGDADDLVQDTHAAALAAPPSTLPFLTPWLRVTLRNLARVVRRGDGRRRARERAVAAVAPTADLADPAALALQAELVRDVGAAVQALDEPFRTVILLRFWHGLLPEAIAAHLGVPRNTVRSRLQRGLERLRAVLDRHHGERGIWQRSLAAFAAPSPLAATGGIATWSLLGWFMQGKLVAAGAATLVAAVLGAWWWQRPALEPRTEPVAGSVSAAPAVAGNAAADPPAATAPRVAATAPLEPASPYHVMVRGRCVDERGAAVPGALVALEPVLPLRLEPSDARAQERSGDDGAFAIALLPVATTYSLEACATDRVPVQARWSAIEPGRTYDLGDLVLPRGGGAAGRVVDTAGMPLAGAGVRLLRKGEAQAADGSAAPAGAVDAKTASDGAFTTLAPLAPGAWLALLLAPLQRGDGAAHEFRVEAGAVTGAIQLVAKAANASLRAQVVDERGAGIGGATATRTDRDGIDAFLGEGPRTDADGWFVLPRFPGDESHAVALHVFAVGYEGVQTDALAWGSEHRIVLAASPTVVVEVRARVDGSAVAAFGLRLVPAPGTPGHGGNRQALAVPKLPRANGQVHLPGLARGRYVAWVEPEGGRLAPFLDEVVVDATPTHCVLHAPAAATRRVRVLDASGRPVAGTVVELVQSFAGAPVALTTLALPPREFDGISPLLLRRAPTDEAGEVEFTAAAESTFVVRVRGPGHRPVVVGDVRFGSGLDALLVTVDVGATVTGTLGPASLLAELGPAEEERRATSAGGERNAAMLASLRPVVVLRAVGGGKDFPEKASDGAVRDDGTFRIDGVPPGSWRVCVRHRLPGLLSGSGVLLTTELATMRDLAPGEERRVALDASALRHGSLRALVLVDGAPFANQTVHVRLRRNGLSWGSVALEEATPQPVTSDGDGRVAIDVPPGDYSVEVNAPDGRGGTAKLRSDQFVAVAPGATAETTFPLQRRVLRVRVLRADGTPEPGRKFGVLQAKYIASAGTTDADGWLELHSVPPGAFELYTWPTELAESKAQTDYIRAHPYPQWLDALVRIGPLQMEAGQSRAEIERRLPR